MVQLLIPRVALLASLVAPLGCEDAVAWGTDRCELAPTTVPEPSGSAWTSCSATLFSMFNEATSLWLKLLTSEDEESRPALVIEIALPQESGDVAVAVDGDDEGKASVKYFSWDEPLLREGTGGLNVVDLVADADSGLSLIADMDVNLSDGAPLVGPLNAGATGPGDPLTGVPSGSAATATGCPDNGEGCGESQGVRHWTDQCQAVEGADQSPCFCEQAALVQCFIDRGCYAEANPVNPTSTTCDELERMRDQALTSAANLGQANCFSPTDCN